MIKANSLPKAKRIYKKNDFNKVFSQGSKFRQSHMTGYFLPSETGYSRLGVSIGRRFGKAHERNHFKRLIREVFRCYCKSEKIPIDLVIIPNNKNKSLDHSLLLQDIEAIWKHSQSIL